MLKNIPSVFSPELLAAVYRMGHGDTLVLADGNFPSASVAQQNGARIIRADGHGIPELLCAILQFMPLDTYVEHPVIYMEKSACDAELELPILSEYEEIFQQNGYEVRDIAEFQERFTFYRQAAHACYIVQTGECSQYANIILQKGVVKEEP